MNKKEEGSDIIFVTQILHRIEVIPTLLYETIVRILPFDAIERTVPIEINAIVMRGERAVDSVTGSINVGGARRLIRVVLRMR
ncbi:hypothetical protein ACHAW6_004689 [Cyclotella cf. meneghiniana]